MSVLTKAERELLVKVNKYRALSDVIPPADMEGVLNIIDSLVAAVEKHETKLNQIEYRLSR